MNTDKIKKMNLSKKLYQKIVLDRIKEIDWSNGSDAPFIVELDTTEICNYACKGCISQDIMKDSNSFSKDRLISLIEEFCVAGVKGVIFIGGGEPLAHPYAGRCIDYLGKHDVSVGITTNGYFIDRYLNEIAQYSNWTRVSVDAASEEVYYHLRPSKNGENAFKKVIDNMRALAKVKKGKLGFSFLVRTVADGFDIKSNIHEIYDAAVLAKDIGCDYYEVKPSYQFEDNKDHFLRVHSPEDMRQAAKEIDRLKDLETNDFKIIKSINMDCALEGKQNIQAKDYRQCLVSELRTLVTPSGAYVCPYFRGKNHMRIGDVNNQSFTEMWKGERRSAVMDRLNVKEHCKMHCIRDVTNLELFEILNKIKDGEEIKEVEMSIEDRFI